MNLYKFTVNKDSVYVAAESLAIAEELFVEYHGDELPFHPTDWDTIEKVKQAIIVQRLVEPPEMPDQEWLEDSVDATSYAVQNSHVKEEISNPRKEKLAKMKEVPSLNAYPLVKRYGDVMSNDVYVAMQVTPENFEQAKQWCSNHEALYELAYGDYLGFGKVASVENNVPIEKDDFFWEHQLDFELGYVCLDDLEPVIETVKPTKKGRAK